MAEKIEKIKAYIKEFFSDLTPQKKIGLGVAAAVLLLLIIGGIVLLVSGGDKSGTYTIEVVTEGGKALEEVGVYVYTNDKKEDLVTVGKTDETGMIEFESDNAMGTVIVLEDVPRGYKVEDTYEIKDKETQIVLQTQLLSEDELDGVTFELGDVFADMSVTATDGKTYKISKLLKEKKAVVLNFWYLNCEPCKNEFPFLQEAYAKYQEKLEVLAVNPVDGDTEAVSEFQETFSFVPAANSAQQKSAMAELKTSLGLTFPMAAVDSKWEKIMQITAYPTTVVIDRYGTIGLIHKGSVTDAATFEKVFNFFTSDTYKQTALKSVDDIATLGEGDGSKENPYQIVGTQFEATVEGKGVVYYQMYKVDGMILSIQDEDAYVLYDDKEFKAENGTVSVPLTTPDTYTPAVFGIGNASDKEKTFTVTLTYPQGTLGNPLELALGEFVANVAAGNDQGVYYTYTATAPGTLTLTLLGATEGISYDYSLYNLNTYAMRNMSADGVADANGNMTVSIPMNQGDVIQFTVGTLPDENNEYPAGEFKFQATFVEGAGVVTDPSQKIEYSVTVKSADGKALAGVSVSISGTGIDNTNLTTNKKGVAKTTLPAGSYKAIVTAPAGYLIDSTEYELTPDKPSVTVKLKQKSNEVKTYTVKVVNESGKAMSGVLVTVGNNYGTTDGNGSISFSLVEDNYTATAEGPDGYESGSKSFGSSTSVTIKLKKASQNTNSGVKQINYTVNVTDYAGNPLADAAVKFVSGGKVAKTAIVGSNGSVSVKIASGNYTVEIAFPTGKDYGFDKSTATLSANKTTATVIAAPKISSSALTSFYNGEKSAYNISVGAVHTAIQSNANNYFIFTPTKQGKYRIKTTNGDAKLSYVGNAFNVIENPSYSSNEYTAEVLESMLGGEFIVSVTGTSECVIIVERYGSVAAETQPTVWNGSGNPSTSFPAPGGSLTSVDISGSGINLVKGSDGYYHKDSADGAIVYVNLASTNYINMTDLVDKTSFLRYFYNSNGSINRIEDYTSLMLQYTKAAANAGGYYPLTDDLIYMIQNGGTHRGWWDKSVEGGFYLFDGKNVNTGIAWMFLLCY